MVPCVYCLYGPNVYEGVVESLLADGHYNLCNSDFAQWPVTPILKRLNK